MEIPFLQARYFTIASQQRAIDLVVIHCAEVLPRSGGAEWLARYCANNDRVASWHYAVDDVLITQSVKEEDVAYHAPGANRSGIGIELATIGMPTGAHWADPYHQKMLALTEFLVAGICARRKIDPYFVDAAGIREGRRGITTHAEVSLAHPDRAGKPPHMDPGPFFPMEAFLDRIKTRLDSGNFAA